jgi:predicted transcriptional regulator
MTKLMQQAIEALQELPVERREMLARAIIDYANREDEVYQLSDDERAAVRVGLEQAQRGEFVSDQDVEAYRARHGA